MVPRRDEARVSSCLFARLSCHPRPSRTLPSSALFHRIIRIGASFGHFSNIYLSMIIADSKVSGDECQWYCLTYVMDSTFGTLLNLTFLYFFEELVRRNPVTCRVFSFGDYGNPPRLIIWIPQLLVWLCIVITGKATILLVIYQLLKPIGEIISALFKPLRRAPRVELVLVMIVIPTLLNTVQFWVTDTFLKRQPSSTAADSRSGSDSEGDELVYYSGSEGEGLDSELIDHTNVDMIDEVSAPSRHKGNDR